MSVNATNDKLGWIAPEFKLLDVSGKILSLNQLKGTNGTVIAFICNHCPYVKAIAERLSMEANELKKISINTIAIMSNDVENYPEPQISLPITIGNGGGCALEGDLNSDDIINVLDIVQLINIILN